MSKQLFEVSEESGVKHSINAAHVVAVVDQGEGKGSAIVFGFGGSLVVKDSYRSVRGYVKKGLAVAGEVAAPEAATAEVVAD